jgi:hypothetical protein
MQRPFPDDTPHWRLRAEEARINAELFGDPTSQRLMHEIADRYERIAQRADERMQDSEKRPAAPSIRPSRPKRKALVLSLSAGCTWRSERRRRFLRELDLHHAGKGFWKN